MVFRTFGRFITTVVSVCLITTTTPVVASESVSPIMEIEAEDINDHLDLADKHLEDVSKHKASSLGIEKFDKALLKTLERMHERNNKKLDRMSEKKAQREYEKLHGIYSLSNDKNLNSNIQKIDDNDGSYKEKLKELNHEKFILEAHANIMTQVKEAGSVRAFVKQIRMQIKHQRALQKSETSAGLKIKTNKVNEKNSDRLPASDGKEAGISLGSLLLITGIILVCLGSGVVGATWVTVGWVFIAVFGLLPIAILLIVLLVIVIVAIAAEVKHEKFVQPNLLKFEPLIT